VVQYVVPDGDRLVDDVEANFATNAPEIDGRDPVADGYDSSRYSETHDAFVLLLPRR